LGGKEDYDERAKMIFFSIFGTKNMRPDRSKIEFYTRKAKEEGYPARSVYKLKEIDEKFKIIKVGDRVLDLGAAPGSWLIYISQKIGNKGKVLGIDLENLKICLPVNAKFLKKDVFELTDLDLKEFGKFQAVVSDLSPKTSGIKFVDAAKSLELCEKGLEVAQKVLTPGGNFVCKVFESEETKDFFKKIEENFKSAKRLKPQASRKESREIFFIGKGFRDKESS
jgi:23S rRNA (uridine2552-2'-O)-methyltransferase